MSANSGLSALDRLRKANLRNLVFNAGGPSLFLELYGRDANGVLTWATEDLCRWVFDPAAHDLDEATARAIERRVALPPAWLDIPHPIGQWA